MDRIINVKYTNYINNYEDSYILWESLVLQDENNSLFGCLC